MKKILLILGCCALMFCACHKTGGIAKPKETYEDSILLMSIEDSVFTPGLPMITESTKFQYDNEGRLAVWRYDYYDGSVSVYLFNQLTRDDKKRLVKIVQSRSESEITGDDNVVATRSGTITEFYYNDNSDQVLFGYRYPENKDSSVGDSFTFTYSGPNITEMDTYDLTSPDHRYPKSVETWTYNAADELISSKGAPRDSWSDGSYTYEYDGKTNPLKLGVDVLGLDILRMSAGNVTRLHSTYSWGGPENIESTEYTYRSYNRPVRATVSSNLRSETRVINYTYSR